LTLKQCTAFLLLLAFTAMSFSHAVIVMNFYARQDYIARNLCENRNAPAMHCCGRCQLRKRLAQENSHEQHNPERRSENNTEVVAYHCFASTPAAPPTVTCKTEYGDGASASPVDRPSAVFHPPSCLSVFL
jgi:hypothetical protein